MLSPMNHREIQYRAKKCWEALGIEPQERITQLLKCSVQESDAGQLLENQEWLETTLQEVCQEDLLLDYGVDCLRLYLLFEKTPKMPDPELLTWEECSLEGMYKFLGRYRRMILAVMEWNRRGKYADTMPDVIQLRNKAEQMRQEILSYLCRTNTMPNRHNAVAVLMEGIKELQHSLGVSEILRSLHEQEIKAAVPLHERTEQDSLSDTMENTEITALCQDLLITLAPFAPHTAEDLWQNMSDNKKSEWKSSILMCTDSIGNVGEHTTKQKLTIPVQINARTKRVISIVYDTQTPTQEQVIEAAQEAVQQFLKPHQQYRTVYVPGKIVNFVSV